MRNGTLKRRTVIMHKLAQKIRNIFITCVKNTIKTFLTNVLHSFKKDILK